MALKQQPADQGIMLQIRNITDYQIMPARPIKAAFAQVDWSQIPDLQPNEQKKSHAIWAWPRFSRMAISIRSWHKKSTSQVRELTSWKPCLCGRVSCFGG
jgi:hypothetical protein